LINSHKQQLWICARALTTIENAQIIWQAVTDYKKGSADFADYIVGRSNIFNNCDETTTFNKKR